MPRPTLEDFLLFLGMALCSLMFFGVPSAFWIGLP